MTMSPAKTAEPIEMPFATWTLVGPGNLVLNGGPDPPCKGTIILRGKGAVHCKVYGLSAASCAKTAESIETGMWTRVCPRTMFYMESRSPRVKRQFEDERGRLRACPDKSGGRYFQSDSAGGNTGTVRMPIRVY